MTTAVTISPTPILQFLNNQGQPCVGGSLLTQVGGVNTTAYQDSAGTVPLPNPIPLNSRGEISNAAGASCQLFLITGVTYTFTLYDANGNQLNQAQYVSNPSTISPTSLAAVTGANLIGFSSSETYSAGTVGAQLDLINQVVLNVLDPRWGALGNSNGTAGNGNDDTTAIQNALNYLGSINGGTLLLPKSTGSYRITKTLVIPAFVTLMGPAVDRYPFNGFTGSTYLFPDFSNPNQWVIQSASTLAGVMPAYNAYFTALPDGPAYNCAVRNLEIRAVANATTPIYGALRMMGSPGAVVDNVSTINTGHGIWFNESYGSTCQAHINFYYSGFTAWQESNADDYNVYCTIINPATKVVPAGYVPTFMGNLSAVLTTTYGLTTNAHYDRCWGVIVGADAGTVSASCTLSYTVESPSGGAFFLNVSGMSIPRAYVEGSAGNVDFACVAASAKFNAISFHAFDTSAGSIFDIGSGVVAEISVNGILSGSSFGTIYSGPSTLAIFNGCTAAGLGFATPQVNVVFSGDAGTWTSPTFLNSWVSGSSPNATAQYRKNSRSGDVELKGLVASGSLTVAAFNLPAGYRPAENRKFAVTSQNAFGAVYVQANGDVIPEVGNVAGFSLDGIFFQAQQ